MNRSIFIFEDEAIEIDEAIKILSFNESVLNCQKFNQKEHEFCILIKSSDDPITNFHVFLNASYYYTLNNSAIIFYEGILDSNIRKELQWNFLKQGYGEPHFIELRIGINRFSFKSNMLYAINESEYMSSYLGSDSLLIFSEQKLYYQYKNTLNKELSQIPNYRVIINELGRLSDENKRLVKENNWLRMQVSNYSDYLKVIKKLIANKSSLAVLNTNSKLIRLLKKNGFIRKYGKLLLNKLQK